MLNEKNSQMQAKLKEKDSILHKKERLARLIKKMKENEK